MKWRRNKRGRKQRMLETKWKRGERRLREADEERRKVEEMFPNDPMAQWKYWLDKSRAALERLKREET
jgi:hypothetical protein